MPEESSDSTEDPLSNEEIRVLGACRNSFGIFLAKNCFRVLNLAREYFLHGLFLVIL